MLRLVDYKTKIIWYRIHDLCIFSLIFLMQILKCLLIFFLSSLLRFSLMYSQSHQLTRSLRRLVHIFTSVLSTLALLNTNSVVDSFSFCPFNPAAYLPVASRFQFVSIFYLHTCPARVFPDPTTRWNKLIIRLIASLANHVPRIGHCSITCCLSKLTLPIHFYCPDFRDFIGLFQRSYVQPTVWRKSVQHCCAFIQHILSNWVLEKI